MSGVRGMAIDNQNNLLAIVPGKNAIMNFHVLSCGQVSTKMLIDASGLDLNHGITVSQDNKYLYASSADKVYSWSYDSVARTADASSKTVIVSGMNNADHDTRTLVIDPHNGKLVINRGSDANIDTNTTGVTGVIRTFNLHTIPSGGYDFSQGGLLAVGIRNGVGLLYDKNADLWVAENAADNLYRSDLGGDIHDQNPADKLNFVGRTSNKFYGWPYCWTEWNLKPYTNKGKGIGTQWAWPGLVPNTSITTVDAWCRNSSDSTPPRLAFEAHMAPLGLAMYSGSACSQSGKSLPCSVKNDMFVSFHGSYDRTNGQKGYKLSVIPMSGAQPTAKLSQVGYVDIFGQKDLSSCPGKCIRPVDVKIDGFGRIFVSSDNTGEIFMITSS